MDLHKELSAPSTTSLAAPAWGQPQRGAAAAWDDAAGKELGGKEL